MLHPMKVLIFSNWWWLFKSNINQARIILHDGGLSSNKIMPRWFCSWWICHQKININLKIIKLITILTNMPINCVSCTQFRAPALQWLLSPFQFNYRKLGPYIVSRTNGRVFMSIWLICKMTQWLKNSIRCNMSKHLGNFYMKTSWETPL